MFNKADLLSRSKAEVMEIAKGLGVQRYEGKKLLTKEQLIDGIICKVNIEDVDKTDTKVKSNVKAVEEAKALIKPKLTEEQAIEKKRSYIINAQPGTLIAFRSPTGKVKSAMITKKSVKHGKFKVETAYGAEFIVPFDEVIWVRTNKRWPRGVYLLLKGIEEGEVQTGQ